MMIQVTISVAILLIAANSTDGFASGAPKQACKTLLPRHGAQPQDGPPPYDFKLSKTTINPSGSVTVTISQSGDSDPYFRGFLLQARKVSGSTAAPEGYWIPVPNVSKGLACDGKKNSSLTHSDSSEKTLIEAEWVAPAPGEYEILHTVVGENAQTFWVGHKSQSITVAK